MLHACPFAVEIPDERFHLGTAATDVDAMIERFTEAVHWQQQILDVEARRRGLSSCEVCSHHLSSLPIPFKTPAARQDKS